jgi:FtsP/CotA-like multicopper oxidase with cupredoxin domain
MVFGREGAYVLANGKVLPTLRARSGAPQRWRIVNAAKSRFFWLDLEGQPFTVIGSDGGLQEKAETVELLLVTPGERADVIVTPKGPKNGTLTLRAMLYNRGYGSVEYRNAEDVLTIALTDERALPAPKLPAVRRTIAVPDVVGATAVECRDHAAARGRGRQVRVSGQRRAVLEGTAIPGPRSARSRSGRSGTTASSLIRSTCTASSFCRWTTQLEPIRPMAWKDTLNVPMEGTIRFLVVFDERPGLWMFHCHILDHADGGLMGHVQVGASNTDHAHLKGR